jgi:hypothetical protein
MTHTSKGRRNSGAKNLDKEARQKGGEHSQSGNQGSS